MGDKLVSYAVYSQSPSPNSSRFCNENESCWWKEPASLRQKQEIPVTTRSRVKPVMRTQRAGDQNEPWLWPQEEEEEEKEEKKKNKEEEIPVKTTEDACDQNNTCWWLEQVMRWERVILVTKTSHIDDKNAPCWWRERVVPVMRTSIAAQWLWVSSAERCCEHRADDDSS